MVCTEPYYRRVMGEEEPGAGLGVKWEGKLIYQHIYDADAQSTRFIPVLFDTDWVKHIPTPLQDATYRAELAAHVLDFNDTLDRQVARTIDDYEEIAYGPEVSYIDEQIFLSNEFQLMLLQALIEQQGELAYMLAVAP